MRRFAPGLVLFTALLVPSMAEAECTPYGWVIVGPGGPYYDHIANGGPSVNDCWNANSARVAFITDNACSFFPNAYRFGYAGSIYQYITVPPDFTQTRWSLDYTLDFIDPNDDGANNQFTVSVRDLTTGVQLASASYNGYNPDLFCSSRSMSFMGNFAGHTLQVRFGGSAGYSNTKIAVRRISLWQWP